MIDFARALPIVLRFEGGYVNDPADPGGATNMGVTQTNYDAWRQRWGQPPKDVRFITHQEVEDIYLEDYWKEGQCDQLPWPLNLVHFDSCVNAGVRQSNRLLQRALGVLDDGIIGPITLAAVGRKDPKLLYHKYLLERVWFYDSLDERNPALTKFVTGNWLIRLHKLYDRIG